MGKFGQEAVIWPGGTRHGAGTESYSGDRQMAKKLTQQIMSSLQNCRVCTEFHLGPLEKVNRVITGRLVEGEKQVGWVLRGKARLECPCLVLYLLLNLRAESTFFFSPQFLRIIQCIQTSTGRVVGPFQRGLGFRIDNADGNWIVMRTHAVHSEVEQCKIPAAPIKHCQYVPVFGICNCPNAPSC
jgi:hypothetical protein